MEMTISNFLAIWLSLNVIALTLAMFRSDYEKKRNDIQFSFKHNSFLFKIIGSTLLFLVLPFTIGKTLKNIKDNKNK